MTFYLVAFIDTRTYLNVCISCRCKTIGPSCFALECLPTAGVSFFSGGGGEGGGGEGGGGLGGVSPIAANINSRGVVMFYEEVNKEACRACYNQVSSGKQGAVVQGEKTLHEARHAARTLHSK